MLRPPRDQLKAGKPPQQLLDYQLRSITILDVGRVNHYREDQSQCVNYDVALASVDLLAHLITARPPFSVIFTLWESMMAALGVASRPSFSVRTCSRKVS
jgi:hypothetical protein